MQVRNTMHYKKKDNSMIFSYKLQPGICNDFNASELMERSGIEIISDISKSEIE